jgi:hypothetical protein
MSNGLTKKDLQRIYNINRNTLLGWLEEINELQIKKTKQTFTPKQIKLIVSNIGFPTHTNEQEKQYLALLISLQ